MNILDKLSERQRDIFLRRVGIKNGMPETLNEVATCYGLTRERVRQIERTAIAVLDQEVMHMKKKMRFMKKWQVAGSVKVAAETSGLSYSSAAQLARALRRVGIPLKFFIKGSGLKPITEEQRCAVDEKFKARVDWNKNFVRLWNSGMSPRDIGKEVGYKKNSVHARAKQLRDSGYPVIKRRGPTPQKVNREDFVKIWQSSKSIREVLERTGMNYAAASGRRQGLVNMGVPLKSFKMDPPLSPSIIDRLKKLAAESLGV